MNLLVRGDTLSGVADERAVAIAEAVTNVKVTGGGVGAFLRAHAVDTRSPTVRRVIHAESDRCSVSPHWREGRASGNCLHEYLPGNVSVLYGGGDPSSDRFYSDAREFSAANGWRHIR